VCAASRQSSVVDRKLCEEGVSFEDFSSFSGLGIRILSAASETKALSVLCNRFRNEPRACAPAGARRVIFFGCRGEWNIE
jgi:hypothetical protein